MSSDPLPTLTVLFADDDPESQAPAALALRGAGFRVVESFSGRQTLSKARELLPDAILLDCGLPDMDGIEVMTALRADPKTCFIPVLVLTGCREPAVEARCIDLGACGYLTKGVNSLEALPLHLRAAIGRSGGLLQSPLQFPGLRIDPRSLSVWINGCKVGFSEQEFLVLRWIAARSPEIVPWQDLTYFVRPRRRRRSPGKSFPSLATVLNHIRNKLGPMRKYLVTERLQGVVFRPR